jgi:penicillin-binding protein 1A
MLAGIPKAPSRNNPISGPKAGLERRNWIIGRMLSLGYIDQAAYGDAVKQPITARHHGAQIRFSAHYAAEMARQEMLDRYGIAAYSDGYHVYTTVSSTLQQTARRAVIDGLITYDKRHGYRGPERRLPPGEGESDPRQLWLEALAETAVIADLQPAVVTAVSDEGAAILFADGGTAEILWDDGIRQARPYRTEDYVGSAPETVGDVLAVGDLVRTTRLEDARWHLAQVPAAQAALVSLDPDDGAIVSIVGGMGFELSKFNRATQAQRQPGSNFKPFLYSAALEAGFTAASIINDAPVVLADSSLEDIWRPENDSGKFFGPTRLRWALTKSRNLVSIRLLQQLGVSNLVAYAEQLGMDTSGFSPDLSLALGTHLMTPLQVATGYAILANGGFRVEPYLIARIDNLAGETVYTAAPLTVCRDCESADTAAGSSANADEEATATEADTAGSGPPRAPRVMDERVAFIIDSILQDVITRGTGRRARVLERSDIAGKTGTTNGPMDAWFSGYNPDLVTTTWVGFDNYTPLGRREFGGTAALPIWIEFMRVALEGRPIRERPVPPGIVHVRIDPDTGELAASGQRNAIFEYFRAENAPKRTAGNNRPVDTGNSASDDLLRDIF